LKTFRIKQPGLRVVEHHYGRAMHKPPVIVPPDSLSAEALQGVIERFVLREGTDYGKQDIEISRKTDSVRRQIAAGRACIVFDPETETTTILATNNPVFKTLLSELKMANKKTSS
jgi:uncharacterized protein YheU (UPF0270 family)